MPFDVYILFLLSICNGLHKEKKQHFKTILHRPLVSVRWRDILCWFSAYRLSGLDNGNRGEEIDRLSELDCGSHLSSMCSSLFCGSHPLGLRSSALISVLVAIKYQTLLLTRCPASQREKGTGSAGLGLSAVNSTICDSWSTEAMRSSFTVILLVTGLTRGRSSSNMYVRKCPHADGILGSLQVKRQVQGLHPASF